MIAAAFPLARVIVPAGTALLAVGLWRRYSGRSARSSASEARHAIHPPPPRARGGEHPGGGDPRPGLIRLRAATPVTLVGGGPVEPAQLARALALAPEAVAADSGGDVTLPGGRQFCAVFGDMDSLRDAAGLRARGVALHAIDEQESTDLEKCLYSVEAPLFLGLGFLGGRVDHTLAAMNVLVRYARMPVVLLGAEDLCFVCPRELELDVAAGTRVSLFPMGPVTGVVSEGLRWPVAGLAMAPDARAGTSNVAIGGRLCLGFDAARVLVILPVGLLGEVVAALAGEDGAGRR